ncbi:MAG: DNA polymerase III subunit beta [Candidatus Saccharicenans sp.]|jgi:DNA polymerase-3 subunit beta|nr:DNA polymerase III subunit beta [Candidatus Saccharicenans sp.]MBP7794491.1 DNA polymerase III subunit beta [Candidatus Saccharicenans sp.]HPB59419.1 DNA polymerase III subunit beta [Candidatus Saccharicenans sp.]HQO75245.1 DNA polymerase III subunit beta [Candidatus Saccharicenans sp.]
MKFSASKANVINELALLQGIVEKRTTMPILSNVLLTARGEKVEIMATDLEVGMKSIFEAEIKEEGKAAVNGKKLFDFIRLLPEDRPIDFFKKDEYMLVKSGESEIKIVAAPEEDFPAIQECSFDNHLSFPLTDFKEMVDCVFYAITQEQRYYLSGALLSVKNRQLELVSTDGHRLAYTRREIDDLQVDREINQIVSKKTLNELKKFENSKIDFDFDDNSLFFRVGNRVLISRIIESKFPNYQAVIPKNNPNLLLVEREELVSAIKRVSVLSADRSKGIKLEMKPSELRLFSSNPEMGEARDKLQVDYQGEELEIGFNSQYLLDFLTTLSSERVRLEIKDENSAVLMKPEPEEKGVYLYVLMPMKI